MGHRNPLFHLGRMGMPISAQHGNGLRPRRDGWCWTWRVSVCLSVERLTVEARVSRLERKLGARIQAGRADIRDADLRAIVGFLCLVRLRRPRVDSPRPGAWRGGCGGRCRGVPVPPAGRVPQPRGGDHSRALRLLALRGQAARAHPRQAHDPGNLVLSHLTEIANWGKLIALTRGWDCERRSNWFMLFLRLVLGRGIISISVLCMAFHRVKHCVPLVTYTISIAVSSSSYFLLPTLLLY